MAEDVASVGVGDGAVTESLMNNFWDYDKKELEKTEKGRIFILERMINYCSKRGFKPFLD